MKKTDFKNIASVVISVFCVSCASPPKELLVQKGVDPEQTRAPNALPAKAGGASGSSAPLIATSEKSLTPVVVPTPEVTGPTVGDTGETSPPAVANSDEASNSKDPLKIKLKPENLPGMPGVDEGGPGNKLPTPVEPAAPIAKAKTPTLSGEGVDPVVSLRWLRNGNTRFVKGRLRADGQSAKDIARLAKSPKAHAIVIAPSDSRVPPEIIFDQKLGEIYTVRTASPGLGAETFDSITTALKDLGIRHVVILETNQCKGGRAPADCWQNLQGFVDRLKDSSSTVKELLESRKALVSMGLYNLLSGQVELR